MEHLEQNKFRLSFQHFDNQLIRATFNIEEKTWYFSIVDVIAVLTNSERPRKYWTDVKQKIKFSDFQLSEKIVQLKLVAEDGKKRLTDVVDAENLKNILIFIPSKKIENFQIWLKNFEIINLPSYQIDFRKGIDIQKYIHIIHGVQVMFDQDVAMLFGVETKRLKEQVKRNIDRFPEDFMFEVSKEEFECSRSQIATLNDTKKRRGYNVKYDIYAFTEHGCAI